MVDTKASIAETDQIYRPIKIVVIGDGGVGKTSLIKWYFLSQISDQSKIYLLITLMLRFNLCYSYAHDKFPEDHVPTILDCYSAEVNVGPNGDRNVALQIW